MHRDSNLSSKRITWVADGIGYRVLAGGTRSYCIDYFDAANTRVRTFKDPETDAPLRRERGAREALAKVLVRRSAGIELVRSGIKLEAFAWEWFERQIDARPRTKELWSTNLRKHVLPMLGSLEVAKVNETHIRNLILEKKRKRYSGWTIINIVQVLRLVLDEAVLQRLIAVNPYVRVPKKERPRPNPTQKRILTLDEIDTLLAAARNISLRTVALISVFVYAGLRKSEALGLVWADVDVGAGVLHVRKQLEDRSEERVDLKTQSSRRTIPMSRELRTALLEWRMQSLFKTQSDFVFTTATGTPIGQRNALRMVTMLANQIGINVKKGEPEPEGQPNMDVHSLRHVFASAMIKATKGDAERVRRLTGHATSKILLDIYSHEFDAVRGGTSVAEEAALIDEAFGG